MTSAPGGVDSTRTEPTVGAVFCVDLMMKKVTPAATEIAITPAIASLSHFGPPWSL
jgi:hypothetical protein